MGFEAKWVSQMKNMRWKTKYFWYCLILYPNWAVLWQIWRYLCKMQLGNAALASLDRSEPRNVVRAENWCESGGAAHHTAHRLSQSNIFPGQQPVISDYRRNITWIFIITKTNWPSVSVSINQVETGEINRLFRCLFSCPNPLSYMTKCSSYCCPDKTVYQLARWLQRVTLSTRNLSLHNYRLTKTDWRYRHKALKLSSSPLKSDWI